MSEKAIREKMFITGTGLFAAMPLYEPVALAIMSKCLLAKIIFSILLLLAIVAYTYTIKRCIQLINMLDRLGKFDTEE